MSKVGFNSAACFSSGPTRRHPEWSLGELQGFAVGRSHRSIPAKQKLQSIIDQTRGMLDIPNDYLIAIMPGSATGAMEAAMWQLLGPRCVNMHVCEVFTQLWADDLERELKLNTTVTRITRDNIPEFTDTGEDDIVLALNGTTAGFRYKNYEWLKKNRNGLVIADATSAAFCMSIEWDLFDVVAFSWQKGLGSEAAHGMLVLNPRAIERVMNYKPAWPVPRLFSLKRKDGSLNEAVFRGETLNTPSMLAVEDCLAALAWIEGKGGASWCYEQCQDNFKTLADFIAADTRFRFAFEGEYNSPASPCFVVQAWEDLPADARWEKYRAIGKTLEERDVAYAIVNHAHSFPAFRFWCGPMVEGKDITRVMHAIAAELDREC